MEMPCRNAVAPGVTKSANQVFRNVELHVRSPWRLQWVSLHVCEQDPSPVALNKVMHKVYKLYKLHKVIHKLSCLDIIFKVCSLLFDIILLELHITSWYILHHSMAEICKRNFEPGGRYRNQAVTVHQGCREAWESGSSSSSSTSTSSSSSTAQEGCSKTLQSKQLAKVYIIAKP